MLEELGQSCWTHATPAVQGGPWPHGKGGGQPGEGLAPVGILWPAQPRCPHGKESGGGRQGGMGGWGGSPARRESWRPSLRPLGTPAGCGIPQH